jgi:hypothetical protein
LTDLKAIAIWIAVLVVVLLIVTVLRKRSRSPISPNQTNRTPAETFVGLRSLILQSSREKLSLPATSTPTEPWGVVMDMSVAEGTATATVTSLSDGNASIYLSAGGGYIGGVGKPAIHDAAQKFVRAAAEFQPGMKATTESPLPEPGQVNFYVLTDAGVFTARVPEDELNQRRHVLTKLFAAGQEVITQYRLDQGPVQK